MGRVIREGKLELDIDAAVAIKWDDHRAFREGIAKLQGSKAVDVAILGEDLGVVLLELKDFRSHRIENKKRLTAGDLAVEVAEKVRDSLAGLTWAHARPRADGDVERLVGGLYVRGSEPKLLVVLWLEEDQAPPAHQLDPIRSAIESALRPITAKVIVTSRAVEARTPRPLHWLRVNSLP